MTNCGHRRWEGGTTMMPQMLWMRRLAEDCEKCLSLCTLCNSIPWVSSSGLSGGYLSLRFWHNFMFVLSFIYCFTPQSPIGSSPECCHHTLSVGKMWSYQLQTLLELKHHILHLRDQVVHLCSLRVLPQLPLYSSCCHCLWALLLTPMSRAVGV
jgi:hypothetical protein